MKLSNLQNVPQRVRRSSCHAQGHRAEFRTIQIVTVGVFFVGENGYASTTRPRSEVRTTTEAP
jgi:hypothetical protein